MFFFSWKRVFPLKVIWLRLDQTDRHLYYTDFNLIRLWIEVIISKSGALMTNEPQWLLEPQSFIGNKQIGYKVDIFCCFYHISFWILKWTTRCYRSFNKREKIYLQEKLEGVKQCQLAILHHMFNLVWMNWVRKDLSVFFHIILLRMFFFYSF